MRKRQAARNGGRRFMYRPVIHVGGTHSAPDGGGAARAGVTWTIHESSACRRRRGLAKERGRIPRRGGGSFAMPSAFRTSPPRPSERTRHDTEKGRRFFRIAQPIPDTASRGSERTGHASEKGASFFRRGRIAAAASPQPPAPPPTTRGHGMAAWPHRRCGHAAIVIAAADTMPPPPRAPPGVRVDVTPPTELRRLVQRRCASPALLRRGATRTR